MQPCLKRSESRYGAVGAGGAGGGGGGTGGTASAPFFPPFAGFAFAFGLPANQPIDAVCFGFGAFFFLPILTLEISPKRVSPSHGSAILGMDIPPGAEGGGS